MEVGLGSEGWFLGAEWQGVWVIQSHLDTWNASAISSHWLLKIAIHDALR